MDNLLNIYTTKENFKIKERSIEPEIQQVQETKGEFQYKWYHWNFQSLNQLYYYLKSNPPINKKIFNLKVGFIDWVESDSSLVNDITYDEALNYLMGGFHINYDRFLQIKKDLILQTSEYQEKYIYKKAAVGSHIHIANYVAGAPYCMIKREMQHDTNFITICFNLSLPSSIEQKQVFNQGCLTLNLIQLLEKSGYRVKLNLIDLAYNSSVNELVYTKFNVKKHNELLNIQKCFFPFTSIAFQRYICFQLMKLTPVTDLSWQNFGVLISRESMKKLLRLKPNDILISSPNDMGIKGDNIMDDAQNFLKAINLDDFVKIKTKK